MPIDIRKYLTHLGQWQRMSKTAFNDTQVSTVSTVACFAYYAANDSVVSRRQFTTRKGWTVIMPNSLCAVIAVGDVLSNVVDSTGAQVLASGVVNEITEYRHHLYGPQYVQVQLAVN